MRKIFYILIFLLPIFAYATKYFSDDTVRIGQKTGAVKKLEFRTSQFSGGVPFIGHDGSGLHFSPDGVREHKIFPIKVGDNNAIQMNYKVVHTNCEQTNIHSCAADHHADGGFIESATDTSPGVSTILFATGFQVVDIKDYVCHVTSNQSGLGDDRVCILVGKETNGFRVECSTYSATPLDSRYSISCFFYESF